MRSALVSLVAFLSLVAPLAAHASPAPAPTLGGSYRVLPNGDIEAPIEERHHSGARGTVRLHPVGSKTQVTLTMFNSRILKPTFSLHTGQDCIDNRNAGTSMMLNPINTSRPAQTIVSLPIEKIRQGYVLDVRDATQRAQFSEACARIGPR